MTSVLCGHSTHAEGPIKQQAALPAHLEVEVDDGVGVQVVQPTSHSSRNLPAPANASQLELNLQHHMLHMLMCHAHSSIHAWAGSVLHRSGICRTRSKLAGLSTAIAW